jgi:hypothetical protein
VPPAERLDSWKAIAAYLRRDERTLRRWEKTRGLPVRRVPGARGSSVFVYVDEIDAWLQKTGPEPDTAVDDPSEPDPAAAPAVRRRRWMAAAAAVIVAGLGVVAMWLLPARAAVRPMHYQLTPTGVVATDSANRERWRYPFPADEQAYSPEGLPWAASGDGTAVFVLLSNRQRLIDRSNLGGMLLSLGADGRLRRKTVLDDRIRFGEHGETSYGPPWQCPNFRMDDHLASPRIAVAAHHDVWWPGLAVVFDGRGERTGTFVNSGWVEDVHWLAPDRLLINGAAKGRGGMVALLDAAAMNGHSPPAPSVEDRCESCGTDLPLRYLTFPPSELNIVLASRFNRARVMVYDDRIMVRTEEVFLDEQVFDALYEFSPSLEIRRASFSDRYWELHRTLEQEGKLHHTRETCPQRGGPPSFLEWRPDSGWRTIPVAPGAAR